MSVRVDVLDGASGRRYYGRHGQKMWEYTRVAIVDGITGVSGEDDLITQAVDAVIAEVGDLGASFPGRSYCYIREFQPEPESTECVKVRIIYRDGQVDLNTIEVGASVAQVETNKDKDGNPITLSYTYPANYTTNPNRAGTTCVQGGLYTKFVPETTLVVERLEVGSPLTNAQLYVGKVNSDTFAGLAARKWLCTSIIGKSDDAGFSYSVTYTFQAREDTWDQNLIYINPDDGKPPDDLTASGDKTIEPYFGEDFNDLTLGV